MLHSHQTSNDPCPKQGQGKISLLLVEDKVADQRFISLHLNRIRQQTFEISYASTLAEGLGILGKRTIDIILLDLQLPDSRDFETFDRVQERFPELPVIIMTGARNEEHTAMKALEKGAQDYLEKEHLSSHILKRAIQYAIKRKQMTRGLARAQRLGKLGFWEVHPISMEWRGVGYIEEMLERPPTKPIRSLGDFLNVIPEEDRDRVRKKFEEAALQKKEFDVIHKVLTQGSKAVVKYFSLTGKPILDSQGQLRYIEGTAQDISERRKLDEAIQQKELAQKEAKIRQEFLAKTSHEIRTPLNPILLLTDILLESDLDAEQKKQIGTIQHAAKTLLALVNDILDISKIEAGTIEFNNEPFSIGNILNQIYDLLNIHAENKDLTLDFDIDRGPGQVPMILNGDAVRLSQILINLITNAIKFTQEGSVKVKVSKEKQEEGKTWLRFKVSDTGIGIPEDQLDLIFESFRQLHNMNIPKVRDKGAGLGLNIVRQLVFLQGGNLEVVSKLGEGSTFSFSLPFDDSEKLDGKVNFPQHTTSSAVKPAENRDLGGMHILLVEDDPLNQLVTEKLLERWNARISIANNGEEGIELLKSGDFQLVLMDLQMPVMDGLEATSFIRQQLAPPLSEIPIIALTANAISGSDDDCFKVGMDDYVSKPIETDNFYRKLVTYLFLSSDSDKSPIRRAEISPENDVQGEDKNVPTVSVMADTRYTDLSGLTSMYGGDKFLVKKTVKKIVDKVPDYLEDMNGYRREENFKKVAEMIHKLKANVVGYMGISEFSEQRLDQVINSIKRNEFSVAETDAFLDKFNSVVNQGIEELKADLDKMDPA